MEYYCFRLLEIYEDHQKLLKELQSSRKRKLEEDKDKCVL